MTNLEELKAEIKNLSINWFQAIHEVDGLLHNSNSLLNTLSQSDWKALIHDLPNWNNQETELLAETIIEDHFESFVLEKCQTFGVIFTLNDNRTSSLLLNDFQDEFFNQINRFEGVNLSELFDSMKIKIRKMIDADYSTESSFSFFEKKCAEIQKKSKGIHYLNKTLLAVNAKIYNKCSLEISRLKNELEGKEYDACQFELNRKKVICRSSKITPKKVGQFVTFWKRNAVGITAPFEESDQLDFYVINVKSETNFGQFVFPKSELIKQGIISTKIKDGKRGFRVYPTWDIPQNKQAEKTQKWQLTYFYEINSTTDFKRVLDLHK